MKQHMVYGSGLAKRSVIEEGLRDSVADGDSVGLVWEGSPSTSMEVVYDYVLDNEVPFVMYYSEDKQPPKVFKTADNGVCQKSRNPVSKALSDTTGSLLVLWTDVEEDKFVSLFDQKPEGVTMLELSNGLEPIEIVDEEEEVTEARNYAEEHADEEEEEDDPFTKEELESMSAGAVKRYGEKLGLKSRTKKDIIIELFGDDTVEDDDTDSDDAQDDEHDVDDEAQTSLSGDQVDRLISVLEELVALLRKGA